MSSAGRRLKQRKRSTGFRTSLRWSTRKGGVARLHRGDVLRREHRPLSWSQVFSRRLIKPELLDHASPEEARPNLADLIRINQKFGGHSVILKVLGRVATREHSFSLLDIGAASGDTAIAIREAFPRAHVISFDHNAVNLSAAPQPKVLGDAFQLPFAPRSFDYVLCSLFLHHFEDGRVVDLLRSFYEVAGKALLVCDLERNVLPYLFLPATRLLFGWERITLHDGPISVRASFTETELKDLAQQAGLNGCEVTVHRPAFRLSLVARKSGASRA